MEDARIRADAAAVVRLGGDLGAARASEVRAQLHEVVEPLTPPTSLVVDLSEVRTVDAAGTRLLTELGAHCQARGVRLCLICSPDSPAYQACTAAGLAITDALSGTQPAAGTTATAFSTLTEALMRAHTVGEVLQRIVDATTNLVPDAELVSLSLRGRTAELHTAVHTDPVAEQLDLAQNRLHQGPGWDAATPGGPEFVTCHDLREGAPWPHWAPLAVELGWCSVHATAISPGESGLSGALNLYSSRPGGLTGTDLDLVLLLATHATLAIAETDAVSRAELQRTRIRGALDRRDLIGQAKGIIMARRGLDADEAFALLRAASQDLNVKLFNLADTLTHRHTELDLPGADPA